MKTDVKNRTKIEMHILASVTVIMWALGFIMTRVAVRYFTAEAVSFQRYFVAAVSMLIYASIRKMRLPALKDVPLFFLGGAIGFAVYVYAINAGSKTLIASVVSFLVAASPVLTALLARVILHEKIGVIGWVSVFCAFAGIGVITWFNGGFAFSSGVVWICLGMVLISAYNIYQRLLLPKYSPLEITTYCIIAAAIMLSVFAPQSFPQLAGAPAEAYIAIVVLGVCSAAAGYLCWAYALSKAERTSEVTNYMFVTPLLTTVLGFVMIGETPHYSVFVGGALVLTGVVLINMRKAR